MNAIMGYISIALRQELKPEVKDYLKKSTIVRTIC